MAGREDQIASRHKRYPWRFRTFMQGDRLCRLRLPLHRWKLVDDFTSPKDGITRGLWTCKWCGGAMNTEARND